MGKPQRPRYFMYHRQLYLIPKRRACGVEQRWITGGNAAHPFGHRRSIRNSAPEIKGGRGTHPLKSAASPELGWNFQKQRHTRDPNLVGSGFEATTNGLTLKNDPYRRDDGFYVHVPRHNVSLVGALSLTWSVRSGKFI